MKISWPQQVKRLQITVDNDSPVTYSIANQNNIYEKIVFSGRILKIEVTAFDTISGAPISTLSLSKQVPVDFVLKEDLSLQESTTIKARRVFLFSPHKIITNGYSLTVKTSKLIVLESDNYSTHGLAASNIITRPPFTIAQQPQDLSTNSIVIEADEAIGNLRVGLVGADGRDGRNGEDIEHSLNISRRDPSKDGAKGASGTVKIIRQPCPAKRALDMPSCEPEKIVCSIVPENGKPGLTGNAGHKGEDGQDGGPTGDLFISVKNQKQFSLDVIQRQGKPGRGGAGAQGHDGGIGGEPGDSPAPCPLASKGNPGQKGPDGASGRDGKPGPLGSINKSNIERIKIETINIYE